MFLTILTHEDDFDPLQGRFEARTLIIKFGISASKNLKMWKKIFDEKIPGRLFGPADPKELSILFINMQ
jgi:hypothetical protein